MVDYLGLNVRHVDTTDTGGSSYLVRVNHAAQANAAGKCRVALITLAGKPRIGGAQPGRSPMAIQPPDAPFEAPFNPTVLNLYALCAQRQLYE